MTYIVNIEGHQDCFNKGSLSLNFCCNLVCFQSSLLFLKLAAYLDDLSCSLLLSFFNVSSVAAMTNLNFFSIFRYTAECEHLDTSGRQ
jgi:hypothetical protein